MQEMYVWGRKGSSMTAALSLHARDHTWTAQIITS